MKLVIKTETEFELPCYIKYAGLNKVVSGNELICVQSGFNEEAVKKYKNMPEMVEQCLKHGTPIEKSVFDNAKQEALSKFYRDEFLEATTPATEDDIREKLLEDNWADEWFEKIYLTKKSIKMQTEINLKEIINYSDVKTIEPYILKNGIEGHYQPGYGLVEGTKFLDDYGDERTADEETVIFFRDGNWVIRYTYETTSNVDGIEIDHPVRSESYHFEIVSDAAFNNVEQESLSKFWETLKR